MNQGLMWVLVENVSCVGVRYERLEVNEVNMIEGDVYEGEISKESFEENMSEESV